VLTSQRHYGALNSKQQDLLVQAFQQFDTMNHPQNMGSGLGLALPKQLAKKFLGCQRLVIAAK